jgi:hypothetical protein
MNIKARTLFLIFILLLMILTGGMALNFGNMEATLAPLLISGCIFVLGIIELAREIRFKEEGPPTPGDEEEVTLTVVATAEGKKGEGRRFTVALGWIGGYALGIYLLGFFLTALVFGFTYLKARGRSWASSAVFAACFTAALYLIFALAFKANLYPGLVFRAIST